MRSRIFTIVALLVAGAAAEAQNQTAPPQLGSAPVYDPPRPTPVVQNGQPVETAPRSQPPQLVGYPATTGPQVPQVPVGDTPLDSLMLELKAMQAQKVAIAKREAEVVAEVRRRLAEYNGALQKLGHGMVQSGKSSPSPTPSYEVVPPTTAPTKLTGSRKTGTYPDPVPQSTPPLDVSPAPETIPAPASNGRGTTDPTSPRSRAPATPLPESAPRSVPAPSPE